MPLKLLLLVVVMAMFGLTASAQGGKTVIVANNQQLVEALENPSVQSLLLEEGYYELLGRYANEGTKVERPGGNRAINCLYYIIPDDWCFQPVDGWANGQANCGTQGAFPDPCPPDNIAGGAWSILNQPAGSTLQFLNPLNEYEMDFRVDMPGEYILLYTWPAPYNTTGVFATYRFFGPYEIEISALDVCALSTTVNYSYTTDFGDPLATWQWYLDGAPYAGPAFIPGGATGSFTLTVPECGYYSLVVEIIPIECPPVSDQIYIDFSCEPVADAGPDKYVCDDPCVLLDGNITIDGPVSPVVFEYSWVNISGPQGQTLVLDPVSDYDVFACRAASPPACSYGEYVVQLQVQNGECYDEDDATIIFYEQPEAIAGPDQHLCNTFTFQLAAVPYLYCGQEGVNYWPTRYWSVVSKADPGATITFSPSLNDPNATVTITSSAPCPFGLYEFRWTEINSKGANLGGCQDHDNVQIYIFEDPDPDAGDDFVLCNTFTFYLDGTDDTPCYEGTAVEYEWELVSQPGTCNVEFIYDWELDPMVVIGNCTGCEYGKYTFALTQYNGYLNVTGGVFTEICSSTDYVDVWIMEEPEANAGPDQHLCNTFAFDLAADPSDFCGVAGIDYFTWGEWEFVGGPAPATIMDVNNPASGVTINTAGVECPYGAYTFRWTEYNGFGTPFQGCVDYDEVTIFIYEDPEPDAGDDAEYCETDLYPTGAQGGMMSFQLFGTIDEPCTSSWSLYYEWSLFSAPGDCEVIINGVSVNPVVEIDPDCDCAYGDYVFAFTQQNGYYGSEQSFIPVCETTDYVTVTIYQQPEIQGIDEDLYLCDEFEFELSALGMVYDCNFNNWFEWELVSKPEGAGTCVVNFTGGDTETVLVSISDCTGDCPYGEWVFRFTEYNGNPVTGVYCEDWAEVSVFIYEQLVADAGDDMEWCVPIGIFPVFTFMTGSFDYCYEGYGEWSKSCYPGDLVLFDNLYDPTSKVTFYAPGKYQFVWTVWNTAEECGDSDEVTLLLVEQPEAIGTEDLLIAECDDLCIDLDLAGIVKYMYYGTDEGECPNFNDLAHWEQISGPGVVTFADDTDPGTSMCVTEFGCYTVRWNEVNKLDDKECSDYYDVYVVFLETPVPFAGDDASICGSCYTMQATSYFADDCIPTEPESYWSFYNYVPPVDPCPTDEFAIIYSPSYYLYGVNNPNAIICVENDCLGSHYGTYGFIWVNSNGYCTASDTVFIEFKKEPEPVSLTGVYDPSNCVDSECPDCEVNCLYPENTPLEVCAWSSLEFAIDWACFCYEGGPIPGYTYEWSFIGPAGSYMIAEPYWYDCDDECWRGTDYVQLFFGECCDTARLYLTITTPQGCELTEEWKFVVLHGPCADIEGPEVAEVGIIETYCSCELEEPDPCLLYDWTVVHCGIIVGGQGTQCIDVLWTDYNVNNGWGQITVTVVDTCTGCCSYDEMDVKVYPPGTLGDETLYGHVYYHNNYMTPLNGVEITLWNSGIPVMSTTSFNDIDGGNGMGYYAFPNVNGLTDFVLTATYDAPWYGANATDALFVELYVVGTLPGTLLVPPVEIQMEAMDVNNSNTITALDALWIKQRAISMVTYFPAGDWAFHPSMMANASDSPYNIMTLNTGDANRSNVPNSMKAAPAIELITDGVMTVVTGQEFLLPIRVEKSDVFGAITLDLGYNAEKIDVLEVTPIDGMVTNLGKGNVRIAYSSTNPMVLSANETVVTLRMKALAEVTTGDLLFTIGGNSEFAGPDLTVIEPVILKTYGVSTTQTLADYFLSANRPNPFNNLTTIEYTLPETGKVRLSVMDMLGQELEVLVEATQSAGIYEVKFSAVGLAPGVYIYKIVVEGETRDYISTQRMVISQ